MKWQAAEQLQCSSLVCVHRTEFLLHGGDRRWLTSSDGRLPRHVPFKLHNLQQLNRILAHRPWTIDPSFISVSIVMSVLLEILDRPLLSRWRILLSFCHIEFRVFG